MVTEAAASGHRAGRSALALSPRHPGRSPPRRLPARDARGV